MKTNLIKILALLFSIMATGCAARTAPEQAHQQPTSKAYQTTTQPVVAELECTTANHLGCRHKGRIYPWNAWIEIKGYSSKQYAIKEVIEDGNRATVLVVER